MRNIEQRNCEWLQNKSPYHSTIKISPNKNRSGIQETNIDEDNEVIKNDEKLNADNNEVKSNVDKGEKSSNLNSKIVTCSNSGGNNSSGTSNTNKITK